MRAGVCCVIFCLSQTVAGATDEIRKVDGNDFCSDCVSPSKYKYTRSSVFASPKILHSLEHAESKFTFRIAIITYSQQYLFNACVYRYRYIHSILLSVRTGDTLHLFKLSFVALIYKKN